MTDTMTIDAPPGPIITLPRGADLLPPGGALQQVRSNYATAVRVQQPRELPLVHRRLLEEARLAGESFYYGWGAGENAIEGPSIDLAVAAARCWGNCATEMQPVQDLSDSWIFTATFIDLETGYTRSRQFRQSKKWTVHGKLDAERKDDVRFQIGQSKAERNVILKALPSSLIAAALAAAKEGVRKRIDEYVAKNGLPKAVDLTLAALAKCGVKEELILQRCNVARRDGIGIDHLVMLRGDLAAIQGGQERAETLYPGSFKSRSEGLAEKLAEQAPPAAAASAPPPPPPAATEAPKPESPPQPPSASEAEPPKAEMAKSPIEQTATPANQPAPNPPKERKQRSGPKGWEARNAVTTLMQQLGLTITEKDGLMVRFGADNLSDMPLDKVENLRQHLEDALQAKRAQELERQPGDEPPEES